MQVLLSAPVSSSGRQRRCSLLANGLIFLTRTAIAAAWDRLPTKEGDRHGKLFFFFRSFFEASVAVEGLPVLYAMREESLSAVVDEKSDDCRTVRSFEKPASKLRRGNRTEGTGG